MCNRLRSIKDWFQIPRLLYSGLWVNFEFNPNVAPTEIVLALIAGNGVVLARRKHKGQFRTDLARPDQRTAGYDDCFSRSRWSNLRRLLGPLGGCEVDVLLARGVLH